MSLSAGPNVSLLSTSSIFDAADGQRTLKSAIFFILLDDGHCANTVQMPPEEADHSWTSGHLPVTVFTFGGRAVIFKVEAKKCSKIVNTSTAFVRKMWRLWMG